MSGKAAMTVVFISVVVTLTATFLLTVFNQHLWENYFRDPEVEITNVLPTGAGQNFMVSGTSKDIPGGEMLWLVAKPSGSAKFFPQSGPCQSFADGRWNCPLLTVSSGDSPDAAYRVMIVRADARAVYEFLRYGVERDQEFSGMDQLPVGAQSVTEITVS